MAKHPPPVQNPPQLEYKCDKCNVTLRSLERLAQHQQKAHNKVKCDYCTRKFKNITARDAHQAAKHPFRCHYCSCQFPTDVLRYQHELTQHPIHNRDLVYQQAYNHTGSLAIIQHTFPVASSHHDSEEYPPSCSSSVADSSSSASSSKSSCVSSGFNLSSGHRSDSRSLHRTQSLPALTNQVPMCRSPSGSSSLSVVEVSSLSSPFMLHQSESSTDSDAGQLESPSASESRVAVETNLEMSEDTSYAHEASPTMSNGMFPLYTLFSSIDDIPSLRDSRK